MEHIGETVTVTVDYGLEEYEQVVRDFVPLYFEAKDKRRNRYFPWNWSISERAMFVVLVPLIFRWKKAKVGVCKFTFSKMGITRMTENGSASRSRAQVSVVHHLSTAYLIELAAGGAMPVPYRVLNAEQRTLFESFATHTPNKSLKPDASKAGAG